MTNRQLNIPLTHLGNKSSPSLYWPQLLPFRGPSRWRVARYSRRRGPWAGRGRGLSHYDVGDGPRHKLWSSGLGPVTTCKTPASSNKRSMKILQNTSLAITLHVTIARLKENIGKSLHYSKSCVWWCCCLHQHVKTWKIKYNQIYVLSWFFWLCDFSILNRLITTETKNNKIS